MGQGGSSLRLPGEGNLARRGKPRERAARSTAAWPTFCPCAAGCAGHRQKTPPVPFALLSVYSLGFSGLTQHFTGTERLPWGDMKRFVLGRSDDPAYDVFRKMVVLILDTIQRHQRCGRMKVLVRMQANDYHMITPCYISSICKFPSSCLHVE